MVKNTDVEMKEAPSQTKNKKTDPKIEDVAMDEGEAEEPKKDPDLLTLEDIKDYVRQIEKSVSAKEPRYMSRVMRSLVNVRRRLNQTILRKLFQGYLLTQAVQRDELIAFLDKPMESNGIGPTFRPKSGKSATIPVIPEVEIYLHLLLIIHLIDLKKYTQAVACSEKLMTKIIPLNRRTLGELAAKCYFYHSRGYELTNQLENSDRKFFHSRLRTATLRSDFDGQASILNLLLRNYLHYNLIEQADKLVSKSTFPETASNNEWARYLFYLGRIKSAQLEYSDAHKHLLQALRKAPTHGAVGFKQTVHKLAITVELLLGDIPDRHLFRQPSMRKTLAPYFQLTQGIKYCNAIRDGVIEATIDHEKGYVQSKEISDIYNTREPMTAFHQRISFCLDIHNASVKVRITSILCICEQFIFRDT
ncbi:PSMD3 [Mytilus edulis]|uniref:PSMD3 n=1 Tax=Mytilus edulis TaxID=6550 RepID=A0A8S3R5F4_MYTED|nr:PSMD3 [Mytilus edulis]